MTGYNKTCLVIKIRNEKRLMAPNYLYPLKFMSSKKRYMFHVRSHTNKQENRRK